MGQAALAVAADLPELEAGVVTAHPHRDVQVPPGFHAPGEVDRVDPPLTEDLGHESRGVPLRAHRDPGITRLGDPLDAALRLVDEGEVRQVEIGEGPAPFDPPGGELLRVAHVQDGERFSAGHQPLEELSRRDLGARKPQQFRWHS
jgi:hypothetical protein